MTASMFARHQVNDFASWKKVYNEVAPLREAGGVIAASVHRDANDPNTVVVYHQFTDLSALEAWTTTMNEEEFQSALAKAGVKPETLQVWLGEDV